MHGSSDKGYYYYVQVNCQCNNTYICIQFLPKVNDEDNEQNIRSTKPKERGTRTEAGVAMYASTVRRVSKDSACSRARTERRKEEKTNWGR